MLASKCSVLLFPWHAWQRCICGILHSTPKPREDTVLWLGFLSWLIALSEDHRSMWKCEIKWRGKHQVFKKGKVYIWWPLLKLMVINSCLEAYISSGKCILRIIALQRKEENKSFFILQSWIFEVLLSVTLLRLCIPNILCGYYSYMDFWQISKTWPPYFNKIFTDFVQDLYIQFQNTKVHVCKHWT